MKASKDKFKILTGMNKKKFIFGILCVLLVTTICISGCILQSDSVEFIDAEREIKT